VCPSFCLDSVNLIRCRTRDFARSRRHECSLTTGAACRLISSRIESVPRNALLVRNRSLTTSRLLSAFPSQSSDNQPMGNCRHLSFDTSAGRMLYGARLNARRDAPGRSAFYKSSTPKPTICSRRLPDGLDGKQRSQNNGEQIPWMHLFAETGWCRSNRGVNRLDSQARL
jgi:hypothetical protein